MFKRATQQYDMVCTTELSEHCEPGEPSTSSSTDSAPPGAPYHTMPRTVAPTGGKSLDAPYAEHGAQLYVPELPFILCQSGVAHTAAVVATPPDRGASASDPDPDADPGPASGGGDAGGGGSMQVSAMVAGWTMTSIWLSFSSMTLLRRSGHQSYR